MKKLNIIFLQALLLLGLTSCSTLHLSEQSFTNAAPLQGLKGEGYQGMAIYGNYMISLQNTGWATLYSLPGFTKLTETFPLGSHAKTNHANIASFGLEKYDPSDPMPVLYVSQCFKRTIDGMKDVCYVERIHTDGKAETVQRIIFEDTDHLFGYALQWVIDCQRKEFVGYGNTVANLDPNNRLRIIRFRLPQLKDGPEVHLTMKDCLETYTVEDYDKTYPSQVIGQGAHIYKGNLILPTGFGAKTTPSVIYVWNLRKHKMTQVIDMSQTFKHEMEDCDMYGNKLYIQTNGAGVMQMDYSR
ncbi:MAG: hypothetical protein LKG25_08035 [Prevotella sp.]|jgi:hypothetical protein|nr:hypothetical protein [Prevotella sp.]